MSAQVHDETLARLLYEETARRLSNQRASLDSMRTRAGTMFGAATVATSIIAGLAKDRGDVDLGPFGVAAVAAFMAATLISTWMIAFTQRMTHSTQYQDVESLRSTFGSGCPASRILAVGLMSGSS